MNLKRLLYKVNILNIIGSKDLNITGIAFDSRKIKDSFLFVAIKGELVDGHDYIHKSIKSGAVVVVVESVPKIINPNVTYILVLNSNHALSIIASNFYSNPSNKINLVGVTGTNGKTTIVSLLFQLFQMFNIKVGMLSTIQNSIVNTIIPSTHTTADPIQLNFLLNKMIEEDCKYCFMEVSSHAILQNRVAGLDFNIGVFSNITHDHLDYHKTFNEYRDVKKSFFDSLPKASFSLTNKDDKNGQKMTEGVSGNKLTYSLQSASDYKCRVLEKQFGGMLLNINKVDVWVKLIGQFNAYNILATYAVANIFGFSDSQILPALSMLSSVEGRFQCFQSEEKVTAILDYAHTDDALKNVLSTINNLRNNTEVLITVVGCGGDRDKAKRPLIGAVACSLSNHVILTSDNPRCENPDFIIDDMMQNLTSIQMKKVLVISDRSQAIKTACMLASSNDIVLIAGKGHEKYQEINSERFPFDDLEELKQSLNILKN